VRLDVYGPGWLAERPGLRPKSRQLYEGLLRLHILPTLGRFALAELSPARVRSWRSSLLNRCVGEVTAAKAYRPLPRPIADLLAGHLAERVGTDPEALIFPGDKGAALRRSNFNRTAKWPQRGCRGGRSRPALPPLRHSGNLLAAASGASLRDLMNRMGHDSMRAALIYQHPRTQRSSEAGAAIGRDHRGPPACLTRWGEATLRGELMRWEQIDLLLRTRGAHGPVDGHPHSAGLY
jgi:Phage integrase, N-terminal SAM-like domain